MAANSLYPGFWRIHYTSNAHPHVMVVPVKPVNVGGSWFFQDKQGNTVVGLVAAATAFINPLKPFMHTSSTFVDVELWTMSSPTADPVFQDVQPLGIAGTAATATIPREQFVGTFRTQGGSLWRLYLMEAVVQIDQVTNPPYNANYAALVTALTGLSSYVAGRDGTFLNSCVRFVAKENDALRKKYLLNV